MAEIELPRMRTNTLTYSAMKQNGPSHRIVVAEWTDKAWAKLNELDKSFELKARKCRGQEIRRVIQFRLDF